MDKVFVIDLPVHVVATDVESARDHLARICDMGAVRLEALLTNDSVQVLYVNYPEDRGHDGQEPYTLADLGGALNG